MNEDAVYRVDLEREDGPHKIVRKEAGEDRIILWFEMGTADRDAVLEMTREATEGRGCRDT